VQRAKEVTGDALGTQAELRRWPSEAVVQWSVRSMARAELCVSNGEAEVALGLGGDFGVAW
jgi:hypothetical protein